MTKIASVRLGAGSAALAVCGILYLIWWLTAFSPKAGVDEGRGAGYVIAAAICGIAGVVLFVSGLNLIRAEHCPIAPGIIFPAAAAAYIAVMAVTRIFFKRPVTTELFLITGWTMLMFMTVNRLSGAGALGSSAAGTVFLLLTLEYAVCIVCYTLYYRLDSYRSYIDGCIPLVLEIITMSIFAGTNIFRYASAVQIHS